MKRLMFSLVLMMLIGSTAECATWEPMDSPTTVGLTNVWGTAPDDMFAVGYSGTILHYDGDGDNDGSPDDIWEQVPSPTTASLLGVWGFGPNDVYVTGTECTILHYDGITWEPVPGIPTSNIFSLIDIWGSAPNNIFIAAEGYDNTIGHIIHWDGSYWSDITVSFPLTAGHTYELWGRAADDVYVSGYNGYSGGTTGLMYHYNGSTWELFHPDGLGDYDLPKTRAIGGIWNNSGSPDKLFLAAQSYGSSQSNWFAEVLYYDGSTWQTKTFSEYPQCHGATEVWGSTLDDVYVTCDAGLILHGNSDFEWSVMDSGTTENLNGIWGNGPDDVFAIGNNGTILRLTEPEPVEVEMVLIPGGEFLMGDHFDKVDSDELPVHAVYVDSFYVSRHEITNQQYCDFLNAADVRVGGGIVYASSDSGNSYPYCNTSSSSSYSQIDYSGGVFNVRCKAGRDMSNDPMVEVSWYGAEAYCDYYGYRLPTEAEWEYAARGGEYDSYYRFPWGDTISHSQANYYSSSSYPYDVSPTSGFHPAYNDGIYPYTAPVGSFSPNVYGLCEMAGNIREWCNDWYGSYEICGPSPCDNPTGPASGAWRVLRGGTWYNDASNCRVADRNCNLPDSRDGYGGFRVAKSVEPEPACWVEQAKLTASDAAAGDEFGISVAISGSTALVGAWSNDDAGSYSGSAYLYDFSDPCNIIEIKLTASDAAYDDNFGRSVAISGSTALVGARFDDDAGSRSGSAYLFDVATGTELAKLTASDAAANDQFGYSIALSGSTALVGAHYDANAGTESGSAYLFDVTTGSQLYKLTALDAAAGDQFGYSVAISGSTALVGARYDDDGGDNSGSAYLFDVTTGSQLYKLTASDAATLDYFGRSVAISGTTALVGARYDDDACPWDINCDSGSAYLYDFSDPCNITEIKLTASDAAAGDNFGFSVALSGSTAIVGVWYNDDAGTNSGSAYLYDFSDPCNIIETKLTASDAAAGDEFGCSVAISSATALVGAEGNDDAGSYSGSAYVFENVCNTEPVADAGEGETVDTGPDGTAQVGLDGSGSSDADGNELTYCWRWTGGEDCDANGVNPTIVLPCGTYTIELIVNDGMVDSEPDYVVITVQDTTAPVISSINAEPLLAAIGQTVTFWADVSDSCDDAVETIWSFGDGTTSSSPSHFYEQPGIYTVILTATDDCGNIATDSIIVVVYDPAAGFTTGGGWFVPDSESFINGVGVTDTVSKANFGFIVKYKKGADNPDGNLEFQYKAGDINLKSSDMEWLVVQSATKVRFKGLATINGEGSYTFKVTAEDNGEPGTGLDEFCIEIWFGVVNDVENGPPTPKHKAKGVLGGGNIQIHSK